MLRQFGPQIWTVDGPDVTVLGFRYPTRMAVLQLSDQSLFIWSPTELCDHLRAEIDALGPVRHIIAPNSLHHLAIPDWQRAYPEAKVYAPPGLRKKRHDIAFDEDLEEGPSQAWTGEIDQVIMRGNLITTEVVFFHIASGTAIFTDLIQHYPKTWFKGWRAIVARLDLMVAAQPSVPRKFRTAFTNRKAARRSIARIYAWPVEKVLMAHGRPVESEGSAFIKRAFSWLTK